MNDYYPLRADSLYSDCIEKFTPYLLQHTITENQLIEAQLHVFVELFRLNSLCKSRLPSSIKAKNLIAANFSERVQESVLLFVSAIRKSAIEFLGEYATIYNQINCLGDPRMCQQISLFLGEALSAVKLCDTKKSVVKSFRSKHITLSDLENGLNDN